MSPNRTTGHRKRSLPTADDIPIAVRNPPAKSRKINDLFRYLPFIGLGILLLIGSFSLFYSYSQRSLSLSSLNLNSRIKDDGRLLGHFAYPEARRADLVALSPGMMLMPDAAKSFLSMQNAAAQEGITLTLLSSYRSIEDQKKLFFDIKADRNQSALDRAKVSAPPGFSEHSTGYAIDIGDHSRPETNLSPAFEDTPAYIWLRNNAARYQYTLSFPKGNSQGVSFEPWHWRYEGSIKALRLFDRAQRLGRKK